MKRLLILFILVNFSLGVYAQEEKFKAVFVYNFGRYIDWPASSISENFIICIIGNAALIEELQGIASIKKISNRKITVLSLKAGQTIPQCQILFISKENAGQIGNLAKSIATKPILIITDKSNGCRVGAGINFIMKNQNLNFEVNKSNITARGLTVSAQLLTLGTVVE